MNSTSIDRRNYWLHSIEGGFYMGGVAFVAGETVLPPIVESLNGPEWVIALMPQMLLMCFHTPGILVTPIIERLPRLFPFVVAFGIIQRLPYLVACLALAFLWQSHPELVLGIVVLTPVVSGLLGGFAIPAWMEMVTRMIPREKRASAWAIRFIIGALIGIGAGRFIHWILEVRPGPEGYAVLHGCTFVLLMISMAIFACLKETNIQAPAPVQKHWYREKLAIYLEILGKPSPFRSMLLVRISGLVFMTLPAFLAIHALEVLEAKQSVLGSFVTVMMIGGIAGNFVAGWMGDRFGGKLVLYAAKILQIALCLFLVVADTHAEFLVVYFFFGMGQFMLQVGDATLGVELSPAVRRTPYLALFNFSLVPGSLLAGLLAWALHHYFESYTPTPLVVAAMIAVSILLLRGIPEPRTSKTDLEFFEGKAEL